MNTTSRLAMASVLFTIATSASGVEDPKTGTASGNFTTAGQVFPARHAYGRVYPGPGFYDAKTKDAEVIITDHPLSEETLEEEWDRIPAQEGNLHAIWARLSTKGGIVSMTGMGIMGAWGSIQFDPKVSSAETVDGRLYGASEAGEKVDVVFKVSLEPRQFGTPLSAGGDEPGEAYEAYWEAVQAQDLATFKKFLLPRRLEAVESFPEAQVAERFSMIRELGPSAIEIVGGGVKDDRAKLIVHGERQGQGLAGTVWMTRDGGQWKLDTEKWTDDASVKVQPRTSRWWILAGGLMLVLGALHGLKRLRRR